MRKSFVANNNILIRASARITQPYNCTLHGDKWIIITTIFHPTLAIRKFLLLPTPWNLIVIGDRKTPQDWISNITDQSRLVYLSIDEQLKLDFKLIDYLPEKSYARKNIGYLVAIQCGARIIYESDDDNLLDTNDIQVLPKQSSPEDVPWFSFHRQRSPFINIYGSFGQPNIWPRGFPVEEFKNITEDGWSTLRQRQVNEPVNAYIQQYLADLDPDVDAIYRLGHSMTLGKIRFDRQQQPIALEPHTYSPYNTQNTITHYEAFWGLYLPVTTTFRVCDIWRSYWVQRLLWDIGGHLVFGTATVKQHRNAHSYVKDMDEEQQMYHQSGKFVRFLDKWQSSLPTLFERISQISRDIAQQQFWDKSETDMIDAWLTDLHRIGYTPPIPITTPQDKKLSSSLQKRAAVCVTDVTECINEAWRITEQKIRKRLKGDIDVFLYLSSTMRIDQLSTVPLETRLTDVRRYTATTKIIYEDREVDPRLPSTCKVDSSLTDYKISLYYQQLWALAQCYKVVKEYEQKMNIEYQLLIRSRVSVVFGRVPSTYERNGIMNVNTTILIPSANYSNGYNDGFAIGPIDQMSHYMLRWYKLQKCHSGILHPETFLKHILQTHTTFQVDNETSDDVIQRGQNQCH
ncbi:unnamed protein product [Didymodactylos carnosus]|uniref:Uncharacterized protein n=1 Tax=Didymodactylos carnosus TaxID=1234261 RepID=A0A815KTF4_9BILA|nr:unnamed protein product [Didymodactylos carnosus]CAF1395271.1 unnamed protein product [Didymodactylos carnosus]CAF4197666.1 unnamed protein product [Didymodactylos carnosus]CAF4289463.1 unnamed protein product [Didymodactylos carnosus]